MPPDEVVESWLTVTCVSGDAGTIRRMSQLPCVVPETVPDATISAVRQYTCPPGGSLLFRWIYGWSAFHQTRH